MEIRRLDISARSVSPAAPGLLVTAAGETETVWQVPEEAPLAILLNGEGFAVMMATPADMEDFAVGFALTEGIVRDPSGIDSLRIAEAADGYLINLVLDPARVAAVADRRRTLAGRAGSRICGAQSIAAALPPPARVVPWAPAPEVLRVAYAAFPAAQVMKRDNRSTHAAAFVDRAGRIVMLREDIGRHNALDKLGGALARAGLSAADGFIMLSSRISVEMVQKAAALGAPFLAAVSAPSALALRVAAEAGMGLAGRAGEGVMMFESAEVMP